MAISLPLRQPAAVLPTFRLPQRLRLTKLALEMANLLACTLNFTLWPVWAYPVPLSGHQLWEGFSSRNGPRPPTP